MTAAALRFEQVALARGGRMLFEGLDLQLGAGDALHLSGPNGSGKSSLIRLAAGLLSPSAGRVETATAALSDDKLALDPELTLQKALHFWAPSRAGVDRVNGALESLGIGHLADIPVRLLSTGQAKRASLARVAASGAALWLLDEPLNGLDSAGAERLGALMVRHRSSGGAVVAASHFALAGDWASLELGR